MSDWVTWVSFATGLVGLALAFLFWKRPARSTLRVTTEVYPLTKTAAPDLQITFRNEVVADPRLLVIELANAGPADLSSATFKDGFLRVWCARKSQPRVMGSEGMAVGELVENASTVAEQGGGGGTYVDIHPRLLASGAKASVSVICSGDPRAQVLGQLPDFKVSTTGPVVTPLSRTYDIALIFAGLAVVGAASLWGELGTSTVAVGYGLLLAGGFSQLTGLIRRAWGKRAPSSRIE